MIFLVVFFGQLFLLYLLKRALTLYLSLTLHRMTGSERWTVNLLAFLFWPGTVIHELAHYLMAVILRVPVFGMSLIPKLEEKGYVKLGSVSIAQSDLLRRFFIGIAPFVIGTALLIGTLFLVTAQNWFQNKWILVLVGYIVFELGNTMFSSRKDMEGAIKLLFILAVIILILFLFGVRLRAIELNSQLPFNLDELFKKADLFLLIPLGIDLIVIILLRFFQRLSHA